MFAVPVQRVGGGSGKNNTRKAFGVLVVRKRPNCPPGSAVTAVDIRYCSRYLVITICIISISIYIYMCIVYSLYLPARIFYCFGYFYFFFFVLIFIYFFLRSRRGVLLADCPATGVLESRSAYHAPHGPM